MKLLIFTGLALIFSANLFAQYDYNPYESIGKKADNVLTLSNGKYKEWYDNDTIVRIGSVLYNRFSKKIIAFIETDTLRSEANMEPEVTSKWLSPDPLAHKYPCISPYVFALDNPIIFRDGDGRVVLDLDGNPVTFTDGKVVGNLDSRTRSFLEALAKTPKGAIALQKAIDVKQQVKFVFNENEKEDKLIFIQRMVES